MSTYPGCVYQTQWGGVRVAPGVFAKHWGGVFPCEVLRTRNPIPSPSYYTFVDSPIYERGLLLLTK